MQPFPMAHPWAIPLIMALAAYCIWRIKILSEAR